MPFVLTMVHLRSLLKAEELLTSTEMYWREFADAMSDNWPMDGCSQAVPHYTEDDDVFTCRLAESSPR